MVVVSNSSAGVIGCQKWDVEKRLEACNAVVHQLQEDFYGLVRDVAARDNDVFHWKLYNGIVIFLSLHLLNPSRNSTSPLPPLLLSSLYLTNHHIGRSTHRQVHQQRHPRPSCRGCLRTLDAADCADKGVKGVASPKTKTPIKSIRTLKTVDYEERAPLSVKSSEGKLSHSHTLAIVMPLVHFIPSTIFTPDTCRVPYSSLKRIPTDILSVGGGQDAKQCMQRCLGVLREVQQPQPQHFQDEGSLSPLSLCFFLSSRPFPSLFLFPLFTCFYFLH